jgi:hypothetical protein
MFKKIGADGSTPLPRSPEELRILHLAAALPLSARPSAAKKMIPSAADMSKHSIFVRD